MTLAAGQLRHWLEFQRMGQVVDSQGEYVGEDWLPVATLWGHVAPLSAKEQIEAASMQSQVIARVTIRYRTDIDATCRIRFRGGIYNIAGVIPDNVSGLEWLTLPVSRGLNTG